MHVITVERIWSSFDEFEREICFMGGPWSGEVLMDSSDTSLGNVCKLIPEWNLWDMTQHGPEHFLDLLKHRVTKSPLEQCRTGINDGPGDFILIRENMRTQGLRSADSFENCYLLFCNTEEYGLLFKAPVNFAKELENVGTILDAAGLVVPLSMGSFILQRQYSLLQNLNIMIEEILDQGSESRDRKVRQKRSDDVVSTGISKLSVHASPTKLSLSILVASALDQSDSLKEYLELLSTEPVSLSHAVKTWLHTKPELVPDHIGCWLPANTDRYISGAFFETIHGAVKAAATWDYIRHLLEFLENQNSEKIYRVVILRELSNVCHLEYKRAQAIFKRYVQLGTGSKWFYRMSNVKDQDDKIRIVMRDNIEILTRTNPQLRYILHLCESKTTPSEAVEWLDKLGGLHENHPAEREKLDEKEIDALYDLAVIIEFIKCLSTATSIPSISRKKGQTFVSRLQDIEAELNQLKTKIDLGNFAIPIDNLLEPGMARNALETLDRFVIETVGTDMGFHYQDLAEKCFADLQSQCQQAANIVHQKGKIELPPTAISAPRSPEKQLEEVKQKEKRRPLHSAIYPIVQHSETFIPEDSLPPSQVFKVRAPTAKVFSDLFQKSESRGSVSWEAFQAAMTDIGFSASPKYGSVYTFFPPDEMEVKKSLTLHRPHQSRIEGYKALSFARRLKRVYGWNEHTFQIEGIRRAR